MPRSSIGPALLLVDAPADSPLAARAASWREFLEAEGFAVEMPGLHVASRSAAGAAVGGWLAAAVQAPGARAALVWLGPTDPVVSALIQSVEELLRMEGIRLILEITDGHGLVLPGLTLAEKDELRGFLRSLQFNPGESGKTETRFTLKSGGNEGYLLVTGEKFTPDGEFKPNQEHWVWGAITPWPNSFDVIKTRTADYSKNDRVEAHGHGPLREVEKSDPPVLNTGDDQWVHEDGSNYIAIVRRSTGELNYYASPDLVDKGAFKIGAGRTFTKNDKVLPAGTWYRYP